MLKSNLISKLIQHLKLKLNQPEFNMAVFAENSVPSTPTF